MQLTNLDLINQAFITRARNYKNAVLEIFNISNNLEKKIEHDFKDYVTQHEFIKPIAQKKILLVQWVKHLSQLINQPNLALAEQLYTWQCGRKSLTTKQKKSGYQIVYREVPQNKMTEKLLEEYRKIHQPKPPLWFQKLPTFTQDYLKKHSYTNFSTIPCLLKSIPGLANFLQHEMMICNNKNEIIFKTQILRSASIVPNKIHPLSERKRIAHLNVQQLISETNEKNILMETVLSPALYQLVAKEKENNNLTSIQIKNQVVKIEQKKLSHKRFILVNYVVNRLPNTFKLRLMRLFSLFDRKSAKKSALEFLNALLEKETVYYQTFSNLYFSLQKNQKKISSELINELLQTEPNLLLAALIEYITIVFELKKSPQFSYPRNEELYAAALALIINSELNGLTHITCKSGKDRTGITILWFDTMLEYYYLYNKMPSYFDEEADYLKFIHLFSENFLSFHQQKVAYQNAPGSLGLKISKGFFSEDILNILNEEAQKKGIWNILEENKILASLNKIG